MIELHPSYLEKNGKKEFVVLPVEEFENLREQLEDLEDLLDLRKAIDEEGQTPTFTVAETTKELGLD